MFGLFQKQTPVAAVHRAVNPRDAVTAAPGFRDVRGRAVLVTGSSGLCGARLVEVCLERGAHVVVAVDVQPPDAALEQRFQYASARCDGHVIPCHGPAQGDFTSDQAMDLAFAKVPQIDVVFHVGGLTGPFLDRKDYMRVNVEGTQRIVEFCQRHDVPKLM